MIIVERSLGEGLIRSYTLSTNATYVEGYGHQALVRQARGQKGGGARLAGEGNNFNEMRVSAQSGSRKQLKDRAGCLLWHKSGRRDEGCLQGRGAGYLSHWPANIVLFVILPFLRPRTHTLATGVPRS